MLRLVYPKPAATYAIAYLAVLACLALIWRAYPHVLYIGRDGQLSLWLARMHAQWGSAYDLTVLNPYQGMGSTMIPINPWWNPPSLFAVLWPDSRGIVLSFMAYHPEFTASVMLLGYSLGLSRRFSFLNALWLTVLLFPPFNYLFGLHAWLGTAPFYAHTLSLGNVMASILVTLGKTQATLSARRNAALIGGLACALFAFFFAAPFYNAGMLVGYVLAFSAIVVATRGLAGRAWQLGGLACAFGILGAAGALGFLRGAYAQSARFQIEPFSLLSLLEIKAIPSLTAQAWQAAKAGLCAWGVVCERFPDGFPLAPLGTMSGSWWVIAAMIAGGGLAAIREAGVFARLSAVLAIVWATLLVYWTALNLGILSSGPISPLYFFLPLYPFLGFMSLYLAKDLWRRVGGRFSHSFVMPEKILSLVLVLVAGAMMWKLPPGATQLPISSRLVDILRQEIALQPGQPFRGSVATIVGLHSSETKDPATFLQFQAHLDRVAAAAGTSHALLDLWWFSIPTLDEYGQSISLPLREYVRRFLSIPEDPVHQVAMGKRLEPAILELLGVRFVLTDGSMAPGHGRSRGELSLGSNDFLRLYELPRPNLGNVSPTRLVPGKSAEAILASIALDPQQLRSTAFSELRIDTPLVPARAAEILFVRGGVRVRAQSNGTSALLLPVQFSNCLSLEGTGNDPMTLARANLIHALLVFDKKADATIRWRYGLGRFSQCRLQDAAELEKLRKSP